MNRFEKLLEVTGIRDGHRHSAAERASYFVWYHTRATGERDVDLDIVEAYLRESGTVSPGAYALYDELKNYQTVGSAPTPGRLRVLRARVFDDDKLKQVFDASGLGPLYFFRSADGMIVRVGSWTDAVKYWAQRHWAASWATLIIGLLGILITLPELPIVKAIRGMAAPQISTPATSTPPPGQP